MNQPVLAARHIGALCLATLTFGTGAVVAQELDTLDVLVANERTTLIYGLHIAEELGYFEDVGVDVNWLSSSTTIPYIAFLSNGQADLVMFDAAQTLQAVDAGQPFSIIYEDMQRASEAIFVSADSEVTEIGQLAGKTVGLVSDRDRITAQVALESAGLTIDDVTTAVVGEGGPTLANAFIRNTVDAVAGSGTDMGAVQAAGIEVRNITPPEVAENPANSFAIWNDRTEELRDPVTRFLLAWSKGTDAGRLDLQMAAAIMTDAVPEQWTNPDLGYQLLELSAFTLHEPSSDQRGQLQPDVWARVQPVLVDVGELSQTYDPASFLDDSFIEGANQYTTEELEADIAEWISANPDRYAALAR